jgi:hypothetical protein
LLPGAAHGAHAELLTDSCTSPVLLVAAIPLAVAAVSWLAKRLGLDSEDSAEIIDSEEDKYHQLGKLVVR